VNPLLLLGLFVGGGALLVASSTTDQRPVLPRDGSAPPVVPAQFFNFIRPAPQTMATSPHGDPWLVGGDIVQGVGLDSTAQWWTTWAGKWIQTKPATATDKAIERVQGVILDYVAPALEAVVAAAGGPAGLAAAMAIRTWVSLASGGSITSSLASAAYARLGSQIEKSVYGQTFAALSKQPLAAETIAKMREEVAKPFAQSKLVQERTIQKMKPRLRTDDERRWLDECMASGAKLVDWVYANYGSPGLTLLNALMSEATAEVQAAKQ
jgi:hypothetical protein